MDPREILKKCVEIESTKDPAIVEDCITFFRKGLLTEDLSDTNIRRILKALINSPYRDDYVSIIRDVSQFYMMGRIDHGKFMRILLTKDSKGFLIPEISLINSIVNIYHMGRIQDAEDAMVKIIANLSLDNAKEVALILFYSSQESRASSYIPVIQSYILQEKNSKTLYDYGSNFISSRPKRSRFFSDPFYTQSIASVNNLVLPSILERLENLSDSNIRLQIMLISSIFNHCDFSMESFIGKLDSIAQKTDDENIKADCYDCLDRFFPELGYKQKIKDLGTKRNKMANFYQNTQNAHLEIDDTIRSYLEKLERIPEIETDMDSWLDKNTDPIQKIALERVRNDNTLFQKKWSLYDVLVLIWGKIINSDHKEQLQKRLLEELGDMSDTCFTGHITRMMNVFTGYDEDMGIRISWFDQVKSNFTTLLQKYINENPDKKDAIIEELEEDSVKKLLPDILINIMDTLQSDFVGQGYISLNEYNSYVDIIFTDYGV